MKRIVVSFETSLGQLFEEFIGSEHAASGIECQSAGMGSMEFELPDDGTDYKTGFAEWLAGVVAASPVIETDDGS